METSSQPVFTTVPVRHEGSSSSGAKGGPVPRPPDCAGLVLVVALPYDEHPFAITTTEEGPPQDDLVPQESRGQVCRASRVHGVVTCKTEKEPARG